MNYTRLAYLKERNPSLSISERRSTFSYGHQWQPIEGIDMWDDFLALKRKFRGELAEPITPDSLTELIEETRFNSIFDEPGLAQLHGTAIVMPVSKALPDDTFIGPGGAISAINPDLRPDWGATMKRKSGNFRPIVCGDTKLGWDVRAAIAMIRNNPHGYENTEGRSLARPFEQLQHYCLGFDCIVTSSCRKIRNILRDQRGQKGHLSILEFNLHRRYLLV
ncbi:hypothetical protein BGW36DRAFT_400037 [Talaromyces proteolyticus]|uniref:Uncharacterized protein n=1 Tax=Talaromyces proteolyticus TaxID=1131652 RepID=A0AAD4KI93_9EURO|nr:uncharacterized protein BGW36DRAFT_400037 [Talaromyces proteolyticus]KAH8691867.1 hypothetical protein BGW36DRAFT_400037 [Talaromyces proteolyticus]